MNTAETSELNDTNMAALGHVATVGKVNAPAAAA
jgi:hypothetical protein